MIYRLGLTAQHVFLRVYPHLLQSREEVLEWVKGTLLTHYERQMTGELFERYLALYRERLLGQLKDERPYFYPFKRVFIWGARA